MYLLEVDTDEHEHREREGGRAGERDLLTSG